MLQKFAIAFILPAFIFAAANSGTTAGSFLKINTGSRSAALGSAFAGLADDNEALNINPAGITRLKVPEISGGHIIWFQDIAIEHIQFTIPLNSSMVLGLNGIYVNNGSFEAYTSGAVSAGSFTAYDAAAGISLGIKLSEEMSLGVTAKYITESIDTDSAASYAGDVGLLIKNLFPGISFGAAMQNIGTTLNFGSAAEQIPMTIRAGIAFLPAPAAVVTVDAVTHPAEGDYNLSAGIEFEAVPKSIKLRAGYYYPLNTKVIDFFSGLSAGIGFYLNNITINYAVIPGGDLGFVHRVSAAFAFGDKNEEPLQKKNPSGLPLMPESIKVNSKEEAPVLPEAFPDKRKKRIALLKPFISGTMSEPEKKAMFDIIKSNLLNSGSVMILFAETGELITDDLSSVVISGDMEKKGVFIEISAVLSESKTGNGLTVFTSKADSLMDADMKAKELSKKIEQYIVEYLKAK